MVTPTLDKSEAALKKAEAEHAFWRDHYQELLEKYPDQFVAVHKGQVIAASRDLQELANVVRDKGIDLQSVWVTFVTADPRRVLL